LVLATVFLSRVPLRVGKVEDGELARALPFFPLVGLGLGAVLAGVASIAGGHLAPPLTAVILVACLAALTGGLHLDGLADVFDAWGGGGRDRERMLAIMRDSRVGAHGAVAVALVLIAKVLALAEVLQHGATASLIAFPAVARSIVVALIVGFPYAREEGLGRAFRSERPAARLTVAIVPVVVLALWCGWLMPLAVAFALTVVFAWRVNRMLGGLTGDVYGAAIELGEVVFLVAASLR
jgi:adenosylcobinamide-GDP ribazoletransferase